MTDKIAVLKSFDNEKLIDVVKNYRQYGYDNNLRKTAIKILKNRGINKKQLKLTGNFESKTYNSAEKVYSSFKRNSIFAFIYYIITFIAAIVLPVFTLDSESFQLITLIIGLISIILYFIFFVRLFTNQVEFFKIIGKRISSRNIAIYFFLGIPLFVFLYFYYKNRMNEEMALIK